MANKKIQILVGIMLLGVLSLLSTFLYATYVGMFEPMFVSAVATSSLVFVTAVSVLLTISLLIEEKRHREQQIIPSFKLGTEAISLGSYGITARNIGNGPAKNIEATVTVKPQNEEYTIEYPNVPSGEILPIGNPFDEVDIEDVNEITLSGECEDILGKEHSINDKQEVRKKSTAEHMIGRDSETKHLKDIAKHLKKIRRNLK